MKVGATTRDLVRDFYTENEMDDMFGEDYKEDYGVEIPDQLMFDYIASRDKLDRLKDEIVSIIVQKRGYL